MAALQETVLQRFVENATAARDCATLSGSFETAIKAFGFNQYAYLQLPAPDTVEESVHLSNYSGDWIGHYADRRYQFVDPVLYKTMRSRVPFDWQTPWFTRKREELGGFFDEAGEVGIKSGLTIPFHKGDRPAAALSIASEETPDEANKILEEHGDTLHLLGMYFYIHVERVLRTASGTFVYLTPRESECLKWQAAGKTMWEIAKILSISERTVQFHVDNARAKLGANTIPHAVALAVKNSLIKI